MKLKQLMTFNNLSGLLNITSTIAKELNGASFSIGHWYDGTKEDGEESFLNFDGMTAQERATADRNYKIKLGDAEVWNYFDTTGKTEAEVKELYNDLACIFKTREAQLNRQFYSLLIKYNPLDNYDRKEEQTHEEENTIGARDTTFTQGARSTTTNKGARTDSNTEASKVSPFNATAYSKSKEQVTSTFTSGAENDTQSTQTATDRTQSQQAKDSNEGGYSLRAHGNIGVTTSDQLITSFRETSMFSFYDELLKVVQEDVLKMVLD